MWASLSSNALIAIFVAFMILFLAAMLFSMCLATCCSGLDREQKKQERRKSLAFLLASSAIPSVRLLQGVDLDRRASQAQEGEGEQDCRDEESVLQSLKFEPLGNGDILVV